MSIDSQELEPAWAAFHAGQFAEAIALASGSALPEALQLRGLAAFHLGSYGEAQDQLGKFAQQSGQALDWFNFANAAALGRDAKLAMEAFEQCRMAFNSQSNKADISFPMMTWYFCKAMQTAEMLPVAKPLMEALQSAYQTARITDPQYLYTRGLPALEDFIELYKEWLPSLPISEAQAYWKDLQTALDAPGKSALQALKP